MHSGGGGACALFLNQPRNRVEQGGEMSAGGPPLKLYGAVRLMLAREKGQHVALRIVKDKAAHGVSGRELEWQRDVGFVESP